MSEAWVYIDESHMPFGMGEPDAKPFWLGALVTPAPISHAVAREALKNLAGDSDATGNAQDAETARRGYFHASFDSKNAHSWLCRAIVERGVQAAFFGSQWFFNREDSENIEGARLHGLSALLGTSFVLECDFDAVHFVIATRAESFDRRHVEDWPAYCRTTRLEALVDMPQMPLRFPRITAVAADGGDPGVQVCDFVLWAVQRAQLVKNKPTAKGEWVERLKLFVWASGGRVDGAHQTIRAQLGSDFIMGRFFMPGVGATRSTEALTDAERFALVEDIAADVRRAAASAEGNPRIRHLIADLKAAVAALPRIRAERPFEARDAANALLQSFLLICDTLPICNPSDAASSARAAEKRNLAARFLAGRQRLWLPDGARL